MQPLPREDSSRPEPAHAGARFARREALALAALLWSVPAVGYTRLLAGRSFDDFYITYRYAWNLAAGRGFVFNPGERVFGTTAP